MIARKVYLKFSTRLLITFMGLIALSFVSRYMGAEAIGMLGYALSLVGLFLIFSDLGLNNTHIKKISEGKDIKKGVGTFAFLKILAIFFMSFIFLTYMYFYGSYRETDEQVLVIYIIFLSILILQFSHIFKATFESQTKIAKTSLPNVFARFFSSSTRILVAFFGLGIYWLATAEVIYATILIIFYIYLFRSYEISKPSIEYIKLYLSFSLPLIFIGSISIIATNIDRILIAEYASIKDVGNFTAYRRIAKSMNNISSILVGLLIPLISEAYSKKDFKRLTAIVSKSERYLSLILTPILGIVIVCSEYIGEIVLGPEFIESSDLLIVFAITMYVISLNHPYNSQIIATGHLRIASIVTIISMSSILILDFIFIPNQIFGFKVIGMGAMGAAIATLLSMIINGLLGRYYAFKITGTKQDTSVFWHIFSVTLTIPIVYHLRTVLFSFSSSSFIMIISNFIVLSLFLIFLYFLLLYFFGEIRKEDIHLLKNTLNFSEMKKYLKKELKN